MQVIKLKTSPNPQLLKGTRKCRVRNKPYLLNFKRKKLNNSRVVSFLCLIPITFPWVGKIQVWESGSFFPENWDEAGWRDFSYQTASLPDISMGQKHINSPCTNRHKNIRRALQGLAPSRHSQLLVTQTQHRPHQPFSLSLNHKSRRFLLTLPTLSINLVIEITCGVSLLQCEELEQWAASLGMQQQQHTMLSLSSGLKLDFHQALDEKVLRDRSFCVSTLETEYDLLQIAFFFQNNGAFSVCKPKIQVEYFKILSVISVNWDLFLTRIPIWYPYFSLQD